MLDLNLRQFLNVSSTDWDFTKDDPSLVQNQLLEIMEAKNGIGLAANQVGLNKRAFAIGSEHMSYFRVPEVVFNPKIIYSSDETVLYREGCLSFPDLWIEVKRPKEISVEYFNHKGEINRAELDGLDSRCFQHEYDHLDGICFVDKVSKIKLQLAMKKMRKAKNDRTKQ